MPGFWNLKTDEEVFNTFRVESLTFIGKFKKFPKLTLFENIRNTDYSPVLNLKSNIDDRNFVKVQILNKSNFDLKPNTYYKITAKVIPQNIRTYHNSEFLLEFNNDSSFELYSPNEKEFTELVFKKYSEANTANSQDILKSVKTITYQINKRNETFIYELLQNADDYPLPREKVTVNFYITDKYLLFTHSGSEFNFNNVYSLCAVNAEDKVDDLDKIGFKGIGFKSVFKANEFVYLKSGNYSFRFDKAYHHAEYPWQLMPIWTDAGDLEVSLRNNNRFLNSNVAIALKPRTPDKILLEYSETLELFSDERILLFLRNVEKVNVFLNNEKKIFCDRNENKWWLKQFDISVNQDITDYLNTQISEGNEEIPSKFTDLKSCKISFAALIKNGQISLVSDAKLFNYLPLSINLNLPFLINSDFIPDGEREGLISNKWNEFLLIEAGKQFVQFIRLTVSDTKREKKFCYSIINLIPSFNSIAEILKSNEKWSSYFHSFREGFDIAVIGNEAISFIPNQSGKLEPLSNILIDETGFVELLNSDFPLLTERTEKLNHKDVGEGIEKIKTLLKEYKLENNIYSIETLKADIQKPKIQEWLKLPSNNCKFLKHFFNSADASLKALLESEAIVLSDKNELKKASELYNQIPIELDFFKENKIHVELKSTLEKEKISLSEIKFNAATFYKSKTAEAVNSFLSNDATILNFWNFIYDNWKEFKDDDDIKKSLSKLNILCKPIDEGKLNIQALGTIYLPKELAKEDEVESIIESLQLKGKHFIETKFETAKRPNDNQKWNEIFATAKKGLSPLIKELIPNLNTLEDSLHFKACNEIFKYWKNNKEKPDKQLTKDELTLISQTLKLKCGDTYKLASQCIVSEYFTGTNLVNKIMPSIILKNQINNEYQPIQSLVADWNQFFGSINCIKLNGEQEVFNAKLDYLLSKQVDFQQNHFEIVKEFDSLLQANQTKEIKLTYDFENKFSKLQLQTSTEGIWATARELLFPTEYKPELDLQYDSEINKQFKFLSPNYLNYASKDFLTLIGVQGNFTFRNVEAPFEFYPSQIIQNKKYLAPFWKFITDSDSNIKKFAQSNVLNTIRYSETIEVSEGVFKKPTDLFSFKLSDYIEDKTLIPKIDFSKYFVDATNTTILEKSIGINQELNINQCLALLKNASRISQSEVSSLKIVSIIQNSKFVADDLIGIYLPNSEYQWMQATELFTSSDAEIKNEYLSNLLHTDFNPVSTKLLVSNISSTDFKPQWKIDSDSSADVEIKKAFNERAEYIAFVLRNGKDDYSTTVKQLLDSINSLTFIKCDEICLSILHASLEWKKSKPIHQEKEQVYFVDDLKRKKSDIRSLLYSIVGKLGTIKEKVFYNYLFDESEKAIITQLENNEEAIPQEWIDKLREDNTDILNSIEDVFEGMDLSDNVKAKLKTKALDIGGNLNEKEQSQHNLVAKFAVIKHLGKSSMIELLDLDDSNNLQIENELYKIFSSRGEFAHIQPTALLQLKNGSCKIAIFYGSKLGVKIFSTIQSLLDLNENYIFEYQAKGDIEKIIDFLERNNIESYRFLLINPAYKNYDSKHFQNMNTEKNEEASNLI